MLGPNLRMQKNSDYPPGVARRWIIMMISKEADKDNVQAGASFNSSYLYEIFPVLTKRLFYQGDGYLWLYCCLNNLYISHRSLFVPTYSF